MLRSAFNRVRRRLRSERGFTLIEVLVTIAAGAVVMAALFTMLDVTLRSTSRTFSRVDATQRARTALETVMNELHSACIAQYVTPIQPGSTGTNLVFESQYSNAPTVSPVTEHQIVLSGTSLIDNTFTANPGGSSPNWTFPSTPSSSETLLTNVSSVQFNYYAYQQVSYTDAAGNPYMMLLDGTNAVPGTNTIPPAAPLATPLSTTDAQNAVEVTISIVVGPGGGTGENTNIPDVNATVTDSAVLRLSPAANHAGNGATFNPCQ